MRMTGGQAMAGQLVREGVEVVFGVPGVQLDDGVDGLATAAPQIRFVVTRHEQATTYMADGYARLAGRPGVALAVPGPGMLNALSGLATAYACSSPVLFLVGQVPSHMIGEGRGFLHEIPNQSAILHGLTKWSGMAGSPEEVPGLLREAFAQLESGRPRPVAVEIPPDVLAGEADVELLDPVPPAPPSLDMGRIQMRPPSWRALAGRSSSPGTGSRWRRRTMS
jgi:acetolactate synthase-1/2/3 large subunit